MKKIFSMALTVALLLMVSAVSSFAITKTTAPGSKDATAKKITVVIINPEWCMSAG